MNANGKYGATNAEITVNSVKQDDTVKEIDLR